MITQNTLVERLLYVFLIVMFIVNIAGLVLLRQGQLSAQERRNLIIQNQDLQIKTQKFIVCELTAIATSGQVNQADIDNCNKGNNE